MKSYAQDEAPEGMIDFASSRKYSLFSEGLPLPNSPKAYSMIQYSSPQAKGKVDLLVKLYFRIIMVRKILLRIVFKLLSIQNCRP